MSYLLGIDVGTTRTAAAVLRTDLPAGHAVPEMLTLGDHSVDLPSVVFLVGDGSLLVGDAAERRAMVEPDRVAREFKRRIGDPTPISLGAAALPAQDLAAVLVRHVVDVAAAREGGAPERITLTHPASWGRHKLDLFGAALDASGLPPVTFLPEPQAAAVCYAAAERVEPGSTIAVYDLGGGTFDSAVVRKETGGFTLLGRPEGLEYLGGVDFDEAVFEHVRAGAPEAFAGLDESDPAVWAAVARLRRECREAKEALSADTEVSVPVWFAGGGVRTVVRLHRSEFEELIRPRVDDTVEALRRAVASAGLEPPDLSSVLLVGGSSRIPLVAQTVSAQLGRPVAVDADPKNAIAKGAVMAMLPRAEGSWPARPAPMAVFAPPAGAPGPSADAAAPLADAPGPLPWAPDAPDGGDGGRPDPAEPPTTPATPAAEPPTHMIPAEPSTAYLPAPNGAQATTSWAQEWSQDPPTVVFPAVDGGEHAPTALSPVAGQDRGRSAAVLIGAGGVVAALAVVGALVFWPDDRTVSNATPALPALPTASQAPPPTTAAPAPTTERERQTRERTREREEPVAPQPPVVVPTGPPPVQTSTSQPPPASTSEEPPSSSPGTPVPPAPQPR